MEGLIANGGREEAKEETASSQQEDEEEQAGFWLTDLVLAEVLTYAGDGQATYVNACLTCKRWKNVLYQPSLVRQALLTKSESLVTSRNKLGDPTDEGTTLGPLASKIQYEKGLLNAQHGHMLVRVFESIQSPSSPFYKAKRACTKHGWPRLEIRLQAELHTLAYELCLDPSKRESPLYEITLEFLQSFAAAKAVVMWETVRALEQRSVSTLPELLAVLDELLAPWRAWKGVLSIVAFVAGRSTRNYVQVNVLSPLEQAGNDALAQNLVRLFADNENEEASALTNLLKEKFAPHLLEGGLEQLEQKDRSLLLDGWEAFESLRKLLEQASAKTTFSPTLQSTVDAATHVLDDEIAPKLKTTLELASKECPRRRRKRMEQDAAAARQQLSRRIERDADHRGAFFAFVRRPELLDAAPPRFPRRLRGIRLPRGVPMMERDGAAATREWIEQQDEARRRFRIEFLENLQL